MTTCEESTDSLVSSNSELTLTDLPEECLRLVLAQLPVLDKFRLERVCKLWQHIIYDIQPSIRFTKLSSSSQSTNYCQVTDHKLTNDDWIPQLMTFSSRTRQSPVNISVLEKVMQKFGKGIRVLNLDLALINEEVFEVIANYCPHISCISLSSSTGITDQCLQILAHNYARSLRHINLQCAANRSVYFTNVGLKQLLTDCPQLTVLFLASIRSQKSYRLNTEHLDLMSNIEYLSAQLPDCMIGDEGAVHLSHIQSLTRLSRLIIDGIIYSETTVQRMAGNLYFLKQLKCLTLYTNCETPLDRVLISLAQGCTALVELHLKVNVITVSTVEALSYFPNLKQLDFGLWKPFETGLIPLTLSALQFCPDLQVLRLHNLLVTDLLLENIHTFCPKLTKIYLNNMFDLSDNTLRSLSLCPHMRSIRITGVANIASDITENGVINLLDTLSALVVLEIPIVFDITDDLYSCFKSYGKKFSNNYLLFICGEKGKQFEQKYPKTDQKFSIISKI